jgi:hypothetical protein
MRASPMLPLDDPRWAAYVGGYGLPYDASDAIRRLLDGPDPEGAMEELEDELCHQGDLGSASYASLPWIVEYLRRSPELDARAVGLVLTIEFGRPFNRDRAPEEVRAGYADAMRRLPEVVLSKRCGRWDDRQVQVATSVLALGQGNRWLARTYYELDRATLEHMIGQEFGSADWDWP